ncbi:ribonuclease H-like domain-containing protein [Collybia nuda]|uniref:Ribonuclease H-like domain-containing protein n=1 Tax=Collybia nuda TaxID=64659 RepID=A0A9P6CEQ1_9AGAR|nr:ribonuclease H-like domain-containing protein [Collybia nuda]
MQAGQPTKQVTHGVGIDEVIRQTEAGKVAIEKTVNVERAQTPSLSSSSLVEGELPLYSYKDYSKPKPVLVYTTHEGEANDLVDGLKPGPLAFDLEWRVFFARKSALSGAGTTERRVAVVQLADTSGLILVIQIYGMSRFPIKLQALIENPKIPKMGANILNDGVKLFRDYGIFAKGLVELGALSLFVHPGSTEKKRKIVSLAKLTARYCKKVLDKGKVRTGNWEAELGSVQLEYAGNDVHCAMMIYQRLVEIAKERGIEFNIFDSEFSSEVLINHNQSELIPLSGQASEGSSVPIARIESSTSQGSRFNEGTSKTSPQYLRAYRYWHDQGMSIEKMCLVLSTKGRLAEGTVGEPLKTGTVISYVIGALQSGPQLPFEMTKLRDLVQSDAQSWVRHRDWILKAWAEGRGV